MWSLGTVRVKERGVEGGGVNDEAPLVLERKPYVKSAKPLLAPGVVIVK